MLLLYSIDLCLKAFKPGLIQPSAYFEAPYLFIFSYGQVFGQAFFLKNNL